MAVPFLLTHSKKRLVDHRIQESGIIIEGRLTLFKKPLPIIVGECPMSDIVEKVKGERGLFEKVISYIPGYHGYKEKELRRESDRLVRQQSAANLKRASDVFKRSLSSGTVLPEAKRLATDQAIARLDLLKQRVRKAVGGYAGFFDAVKVREDRLDRMIMVDHDLVSLSSTLASVVDRISQSGALAPDWSSGVAEVESLIDQFEEALKKRDDILSQP
jgi:hypothetical protein